MAYDGNALRRVLLSSMPGFAPTEVKINGVLHEYSTIDGVQEDVVDILLNLKGIVLKLHSRDEAVLNLKKQGESVVTAGDIEVSHDVEIINPDHVIAHIAPGGKLDMQIKVEGGRGYVPANSGRCQKAASLATSCGTPRSPGERGATRSVRERRTAYRPRQRSWISRQRCG